MGAGWQPPVALSGQGRETRGIGCFAALLALISPRLALIALWIFDDVIGRSFDSWILPVLGFFLLPWTTLAYVAFWSWGSGHEVVGFEWFFVVLAFLVDLGSLGHGARTGQSQRPARD
jgi:hypothetical protein